MTTVPQNDTPRKATACWAFLDDAHGIAVRDPQDRVWFADDVGGAWIQLTHADLPRLLLNGNIQVAQEQWEKDERFGSLLALVEYHNTEHTTAERRAA